MTLEQQKQFFKDFTAKMESVMLNKGHDYSGADRLSNFKLAGTICGLKPEQNCLSLIATKVARLGQLLSSTKDPSNESIQDSVLDLANYAVLLAMLLGEDSLITFEDKTVYHNDVPSLDKTGCFWFDSDKIQYSQGCERCGSNTDREIDMCYQKIKDKAQEQ